MPNIDEASKEVKSELIQLLRENKAEEAKRLLQKYENLVSSKDDCGRTAIHWAASGGCLEIVQFCIRLRNEDAVSTDDVCYINAINLNNYFTYTPSWYLFAYE
uniref:ANK_REP_REGION domain-containing protein n=1 Tax=Ascaris lumbricoides TaxID=6252 RepID=A0A0M3I1U9_ASCLU